MRMLIALLDATLKLSVSQRLKIISLVFVPCLALFAVLLPITHNGTVVAFPIILAAWLFGYRGFLVCMGITMASCVCVYCLILGTIIWPLPFVLIFVQGVASGFAIGLVVSLLRTMSDRITFERLKALEAEHAYQHEQRLNFAKDQLILHISHEVRTPLTVVRGYLALLDEGDEQLDTARQALFRTRAIEGCNELILLLEALLEADYAGSSELSLQCEELAVASLVQDALAQLDPLAAEGFDIHLDIDASLRVWVDPRRLQQILRNLLSNALKYSYAHTPIFIRAASFADVPQQVCISVQDCGPGIELAEQSLLFQKFVRLRRDQTGTIRGFGMGLYISKRLVEAMGGRIWIESSGVAGEGSRFCFTLPCMSASLPS